MNYQQQDNEAMLKKAFLHTALTTATIANFLAAESKKTSSRRDWNKLQRSANKDNTKWKKG